MNPGLTVDYAEMILARIPSSFHYTIRFVSKEWKGFFDSDRRLELRERLGLIDTDIVSSIETGILRNNTLVEVCFFLFNPFMNFWRECPKLEGDTRMVTTVTFATFESCLFAIGGSFKNLDCCLFEELPCDPSSRVTDLDVAAIDLGWQTGGLLNVATANCSATILQEKFIIFGGLVAGFSVYTGTMEVFDGKEWNLVREIQVSNPIITLMPIPTTKFQRILLETNGNKSELVFDERTHNWVFGISSFPLSIKSRSAVLRGRLYSIEEEDNDAEQGDEQGTWIIVYCANAAQGTWGLVGNIFHVDVVSASTSVLWQPADVIYCGDFLCIVTISTTHLLCDNPVPMSELNTSLLWVEEGPPPQVSVVRRSSFLVPALSPKSKPFHSGVKGPGICARE